MQCQNLSELYAFVVPRLALLTSRDVDSRGRDAMRCQNRTYS